MGYDIQSFRQTKKKFIRKKFVRKKQRFREKYKWKKQCTWKFIREKFRRKKCIKKEFIPKR